MRSGMPNPFAVLCFLTALFVLSSCATTHRLPEKPPKYVHQERSESRSLNSLWTDSASLFEDVKARRLNDLVTIKVVENITGSGSADTNTARDSSIDMKVEKFFGAPLNLNLKNLYGNGYTFSPELKASGTSDFKGSGQTAREGRLIGTITATVVEIMPNRNLILEASKEITINNEKQILILRGMVRPDDILSDNTVLSSRIADAQVYFVGDGVIQDKQRQGWFVRLMDNVWPF